ncbi:endonuclease/exonuclease/phosphatase family protein [Nonlabens antarcticus]|uniref:endonuclease/exonuclease/phosphatase family protein n=1 Tax=Nonlabens antarcticus TaxID=392714 RepID=UPI00189143CD|nr:endonuclease/exonuclease/phosphatase family protein [Nonlabens antarcticus]
MSFLEVVLLVINIVACLPTIASTTKFDYWWIRGFDFPRIQISVFISICLILSIIFYDFNTPLHWVVTGLVLVSLIYQLWHILPYTIFWKRQVKRYSGPDNDNEISILVSNVLTTNRNYGKFIDVVTSRDPDVFLTLESDRKWEDALEHLEADYPYTVKEPLDNLYGMHLYSKLPLEDMQIRFLIKDDIPSFHGYLKLDNGKRVNIHCLHPRPPSPSESKTSTNRDAELLLMGKEIDKDAELVLVFGDLNDVAWSRTTKVFQKISGLLDPRRGRGFFNTFSADYKLLRWPLDHIFHTNDFTLVEMAREKNIGSDHFPIYVKLNYTPEAQWEQEDLDASESDEKWADEKIKKGKDRN